MTNQTFNIKNDIKRQEQIQVLQKMLEEKLVEIFAELGISLRRSGRTFTGTCCIHGGNNNAALSISHTLNDSDRTLGWRCYTRHCEQHFRKTIIGLIRGILSHQRYGWSGSGKEVLFPETLQWCENFLKIKLCDIKTEGLDPEKKAFISQWANKSTIQQGNERFLFQEPKYVVGSLFQANTF